MIKITRTSLIVILLVYLFLFEDIFSHKVNGMIEWVQVSSPIQTQLKYLQSYNEKHFIGLAGENVLISSDSGWVFFHPQPEVSNINNMFSADSTIWLCEYKYSYETRLHKYEKGKWSILNHPSINHILCFDFFESKLFTGGDREFYFYEKDKWNNLTYPPTHSALKEIKAIEDLIYVITLSNELFFYNDQIWEKITLDGESKQLFRVENEILVFDGKDIYKLDKNIPTKLLELKNKKIIKITALDDSTFYAINSTNKVLKLTSNKTSEINVPGGIDYSEIKFLPNGDGIITTENGEIFQNNISYVNNSRIAPGFTRIAPIVRSRELNDEYGIFIRDFNNDGLNDIYSICINEPNRFYVDQIHNSNLEHYREEAGWRNITGIIDQSNINNVSNLYLGAAVGDLDNDSDQDIYLCCLNGTNQMYLNDGNGNFRSVRKQKNRAQGKNDRSNSAVLADVDNDGDLDLFVTNEYSTNRLFINNGFGFFVDVTEESGLQSKYGGMNAAFADIDNDGDQDLCVVNWAMQNNLYINNSREGKISFEEITQKSGIDLRSNKKSNGCVFGDYNNDGFLDLLITNRKRNNELYQNLGNGNFVNKSNLIFSDSSMSYGAAIADFDQDGYQDLYVANIGEHKLFRNINGNKFQDVSFQSGILQTGYGTGVAVGDLDSDGDMDIYSAIYINSGSAIYYNEVNNNNFLKVKVVGCKSNRDAIGVRLNLYSTESKDKSDSLIACREISSGSGYSSGNSLVMHFGLSSNHKYDLVVTFPSSGIKKVIKNVSGGKFIEVYEQEGWSAEIIQIERLLKSVMYDDEIFMEVIKVCVLLLLISFSVSLTSQKLKWNKKINLIVHSTGLIVYFLLLPIAIHQNFLYSTVALLFSSIGLMLLVHLAYQKLFFKRQIEIEKIITREKIARDLHDDLASTISSAVNYTEVLKRRVVEDENKQISNKVYELLSSSAIAINDIIWIVTEKNNTVSHLAQKINSLFEDLSFTSEATIQRNINLENPDREIETDIRRNLYLVIKEASNNILKHSSAENIIFTFEQSNSRIFLKLQDDGIGFDTNDDKNHLNSGRGLNNMSKRAEIINADYNLNSESNKGTEISINVKMT